MEQKFYRKNFLKTFFYKKKLVGKKAKEAVSKKYSLCFFLSLDKIFSIHWFNQIFSFTIASSIDGKNFETESKGSFLLFSNFLQAFLKSKTSNNGAVG